MTQQEISLPIGTRLMSAAELREFPNRMRESIPVIGKIERSGTGNAIIWFGEGQHGHPGWEPTAKFVITPAERELLIETLIRQR